MKRGSLVAAAVLAASMAAMPALADPGHGNGHGNGKGHGHASGGKEKAGHVRHDDGRGRGHADHARRGWPRRTRPASRPARRASMTITTAPASATCCGSATMP